MLLELNNFEEKLDSTDIVVLQEKSETDYQSACGKVIHGIARKCKKYNVPVLVISGSLGEEINQLYSMGVSGMEASVCNIISLNNAMDNAEKYLCYAQEESTSCT
ncbi:MAG: glycerate kinase [Eubacterium ventriosum]